MSFWLWILLAWLIGVGCGVLLLLIGVALMVRVADWLEECEETF